MTSVARKFDQNFETYGSYDMVIEKWPVTSLIESEIMRKCRLFSARFG